MEAAAATQPQFTLELTQDQRDVRDWVHGFAEQVVRPAAAEWDEREETPWPIIAEAQKIGLYGFEALAQFYADESGLMLPIVNEELFWGDAGIGMAIMGTSLAVAAIFGQGTGEQAGEWIPQCFGTPEEPAVAAFCVSEPDAGSDVSSLRTRAVYDEAAGEWVLNGQKAWATNGGIAGVHVVVAAVERELGARGQAAMLTFEATRPTVGAQAIGIARAAYEYALDYAGSREQFGRPIIDNQAIAFTLADMKLEIDAARLLVWRASWMGRTGRTFENAEGSMSKLKAGEVAVWATARGPGSGRTSGRRWSRTGCSAFSSWSQLP